MSHNKANNSPIAFKHRQIKYTYYRIRKSDSIIFYARKVFVCIKRHTHEEILFAYTHVTKTYYAVH